MILTRAFVAWPEGAAVEPAIEAAGCTRRASIGEEGMALARPPNVPGCYFERLHVWTPADLALVRRLSSITGGFAVVMTNASLYSTYGIAVYFAGHILSASAHGPFSIFEQAALTDPREPWDEFERWTRRLGGLHLFMVADVLSREPRIWSQATVADPGPPPSRSWVLLFEPDDRVCESAILGFGEGWSYSRPTPELALCTSSTPPLQEGLRALHARPGGTFAVAWSLHGDGPPRDVIEIRESVGSPAFGAEAMLREIHRVTVLGGVPPGRVVGPWPGVGTLDSGSAAQ